MKKKIASIITVLAIATNVCAAEPNKIDDSLSKRYPWLKYVRSMSPSPVKGLYEVTSGLNVIYFDPASGYRIHGRMLSPSGEDFTAISEKKAQREAYEEIRKHLSAAIKIGSGPNEVIEITDPDCPFCRRMNDYWKKRSDVTRYVFMMPITQLHPQAKVHSDYILSATDPASALGEVESGKFDKTPPPTFVLNDSRIKAQADSLISGINGTPAYFIRGQYISGANESQINLILKGEKR